MTPIVAIGASAGGLKQISRLLADIPADTGAAFVVLQHLDPDYDSQLTQLLGRATALPVVAIEHGMSAAANRVHVIPPGHSLGIEKDVFRLTRDAGHDGMPRAAIAASTVDFVGDTCGSSDRWPIICA